MLETALGTERTLENISDCVFQLQCDDDDEEEEEEKDVDDDDCCC